MRSPKLHGRVSRSHFYHYYAGYSNEFVEDVLSSLNEADKALVLDPWNGSGTTTTTAAAMGIESLGYDINPVAVALGRARLVLSDIAKSVEPMASEVCRISEGLEVEADTTNDLLSTWFGQSTAATLRQMERAVNRLLVEEPPYGTNSVYDPSLPMSGLAAAFYVLLFRTVRTLVDRYVPSNPAWIKSPAGRRLGIPRSRLYEVFQDQAALYAKSLASPVQLALTESVDVGKATIGIAESYDLPIADRSVSAVVSSPPYCTRIDYVMATLPELAVLGLRQTDVRALRDKMIGTPTVTGLDQSSYASSIGQSASKFLDKVKSHNSRASSTYYRKYYEQYFNGMAASLMEIQRVLRPGGQAVLVVQDSFYKDVHLDLAEIIEDMSFNLGWRDSQRMDFDVPRTMASINKASRRYRSTFRAVESALILHK